MRPWASECFAGIIGLVTVLADNELEELVTNLESDRVERKESAADFKAIRQTICEFANDLPNHNQPGVIFVGIKDNGACGHLAVTDDLLLRLAQLRDDGSLQPFPTMTVQQKTLMGCELIVIEISPSRMPPVRLNGRVWIRVGPRKAQATAEEERRLIERRVWGQISFDQQPASPATLDDLDIETFRREYLPAAIPGDVLDQNDRPLEHQLRALRFLSVDGSPNNAAILLFGKDPLTFLPGAYVQFVRFEGSKLTDPVVSQHEIAGQLTTVLRSLDELLKLNIAVALDVKKEATEVPTPDYPITALRQLAFNAIMHRSYEATNAPTRVYWFSDRVEVLSPGGPYGQVTVENFGAPGVTDYRNPLLAEAMGVLGYVQRFGIGIQLARDELKINGNPELEFDVQPSAVLATAYKRP